MGGPDHSFGIFGQALRSRDIRRLELAFLGFSFGEHATWLAVLVYALQRGGTHEVGVVAVLQLVPGIVISPLAAYAGDRFPPHRALGVGYALQCLAMAVTALAMASGAPIVAYAAAACTATFITFTRPVMGSVLPLITHRPADLVAANVVTGLIEQLGLFAGPLAAGAVLALGSPTAVFGLAAAIIACCALAVLRVDPIEGWSGGSVGADDVAARVFAGFATLRTSPRVRALVWFGACAAFATGVADVLFVTFADERLGGAGGRSGLLAAAYGLGALAGAAGVAPLARRGRTARRFLVAGAGVCVPLALLVGLSATAPALVGFAVLGAGETLTRLMAAVSIQRRAPTDLLARVFGIMEGIRMAAIAAGSLAVSMLVVRTSLGAALAGLAAALAVAVLAITMRLRRLGGDDPLPDPAIVDRLVADPIFAGLPAPTIERLALATETDDLTDGTRVVREGDIGDRYYLVADGALEVLIGGAHVRFLGKSSSFGEIALLRDVPRTATVVTVAHTRLLALHRDDFLEAVTGHPRSLVTARATAGRFD